MIFVGAIALLLALAVSWRTTAVLIRLAPRLGLIDLPSARKVHSRPIPLGGGIAIYLAVMLPLALVVLAALLTNHWPAFAAPMPEVLREHAAGVLHKTPLLVAIAAAGSIQMLLGLIDDWRPGGLSYQFRLLVEIGLVAALYSQGIGLSVYTDAVWLTAPLTILWVVGLTNALNFLDNMDGLAGGVALVASILFAVITLLLGELFIAGCFLVLIGALIGFLRFNWGPAKIFMGDAGSNFLGFWLGTLTVVGTFSNSSYSHVTIFAPLCVLAVPLYDSTTVILLRISQGRSPFQPDKQHFSHRLVALGFRPKNAVLFVHLVTAVTGLNGLLLYFLHPSAAWLVLLQVLGVLGIVALLELASDRATRSVPKEQPAEQVPVEMVP